jgi:hypothetical protein
MRRSTSGAMAPSDERTCAIDSEGERASLADERAGVVGLAEAHRVDGAPEVAPVVARGEIP